MDVSSAHKWTAEELRDLQGRGRVFYQTFPGAKASEELRQPEEPGQTAENAAYAQSLSALSPRAAAGRV